MQDPTAAFLVLETRLEHRVLNGPVDERTHEPCFSCIGAQRWWGATRSEAQDVPLQSHGTVDQRRSVGPAGSFRGERSALSLDSAPVASEGSVFN